MRPEEPRGAGTLRAEVWARALIAVSFAVIGFYLVRELLWARGFPIVHDAAIMHYVVFMIDHGHAPYTSQLEMNLPGALMSEWFGMHVFGMSAAGLWRWDTFLGLLAAGGAAWAGGQGYRLAGVSGALLAWLLHLNDSAFDFGERDWLVAALFVLAAAAAGQTVETRQPRWMAVCLLCAGWSAVIKPYALLLPLVLLPAVLWGLRDGRGELRDLPGRRERRGNIQGRSAMARVLAWSVAGGLLPVGAMALYFAHWPGAFHAFLQTERTIGAWYSGIGRASLHRMLLEVLLLPVLVALGLSAYLWLRGLGWTLVRETMLLLAAGAGLLLYLLQRKGFPYHVYPFVLPLLVLGFVSAQRALMAAWDRRAAAILFLLIAAIRLPVKLWGQHAQVEYPYGTQKALIADLDRLGGHALNGRVQCLDMTLGGCIGALYELRLQQPTGYVNDNFLFPYPEENASFLAEVQQRFLTAVERNPPEVFVLTAHNWPRQDDRAIDKLERWPAFAAWLNEHYRVESTHIATTQQHTSSYRIYIQR